MMNQSQQTLKNTFTLLVLIATGILVGLAAASEPVYTAVAVFGLILLVAMIVRPELITPAVVFLLYTNLTVIGSRFHGLPSVLTVLLPAALALPLFYHLVIRHEKLVLPSSFPWVGLFMVSVMISTLLSRNFSQALPGLISYLLEGFALYVLLTNVVRDLTRLKWATWALIAAGILLGGVPLYQQLTGTFDNNYGGLAQISEASFRTGETNLQGDIRQPRLSGVIGEINRFAQIMLVLVPFGLMRFFGEKNHTLRIIALSSGILSAIGMVLAFSRGAAVSFVLLLLLMAAFQVIKTRQFLAFIGVALIVMMLIPEYSQRIMSIPSAASLITGENTGGEDAPDGAIKGRITEMLSAGRVYSDHPVFGVGPMMFQYYSREYSREVGLRNLMGNRESHSLYLGMSAELGTVGIGLFLIMIGVTVVQLYRARRRAHELRPDLENLATMFILAIMAYMTTALFLHFSFQRYFWLVFGLASAAEYIIHKEMDRLDKPVLMPAQIEENYNNDAV